MPEDHGPIYLLAYDWQKEAMEKLFSEAALQEVPEAGTDPELQGERLTFKHIITDVVIGYLVLRPSDNPYVLARNANGSGMEEDDRVVTWALAMYVLCVDQICFRLTNAIQERTMHERC